MNQEFLPWWVGSHFSLLITQSHLHQSQGKKATLVFTQLQHAPSAQPASASTGVASWNVTGPQPELISRATLALKENTQQQKQAIYYLIM